MAWRHRPERADALIRSPLTGVPDRRSSLIPNTITIVRGLLVIPIVLLMLERTDASDWVAFTGFAVAALTDRVDGALARRWESVSSIGQFLDPLVDKVLVVTAMAALVYLGRFPAWAAIVILLREIAVTALRIAASRRGRGFPAGRTGKWKTAWQLVAVGGFLIPSEAVGWRAFRGASLGVAIALTLISGWEYLRRAPALLSRT